MKYCKETALPRPRRGMLHIDRLLYGLGMRQLEFALECNSTTANAPYQPDLFLNEPRRRFHARSKKREENSG